MPTSRNRSMFELRYHLVLVTKYRRRCLTAAMLTDLKESLAATLALWRCALIECGGEADHVHCLFEAHPALDLSGLVNNLKTVTSRRLRRDFGEHLSQFYRKPVLWHSAYYVGSVGGVTLETVKRYVERQGEDHWPEARRQAQTKLSG